MKLIINTSTLYVGGGVQVAISFLNEISKSIDHEYHVFLSNETNKYIDRKIFSQNFYFYLIETSPSKLSSRKNITNFLDELEEKIRPDIVFTVFGPSYWKPKAKHISGFADGWVYNKDSIVYKKLPFFKRMKMILHSNYKAFFLKKDSDFFILETEDAKNKLAKSLNIKKNKIYVVGNTYSSVFDNYDLVNKENPNYIKLPEKKEGIFRLMYIAHNHINKNLIIIRDLIDFFHENKIELVLTIDKNSYTQLFPEKPSCIINIGPISQKSCPSIYNQSDALFAPTLLETFSAVYPEAMKMQIPILTSNFSFATDICANAAIYFDPLNKKDIIEKIKSLVNNEKRQKELTDFALEQLKKFETSKSRAEKYINICENLSKKEKTNV